VGCEFVKKVQASTRWGRMLQSSALEKVISDITEDALKAGANTVLIVKKEKGWMGSSVDGPAYRCLTK